MAVLSAIVVGAGFSGLCAGIGLRRAGIEDFVILEKADRVGGTWRDNAYPGAASLLILKLAGNKIGCMFRSGELATNNANWPFVGVAIARAEQIIVDGNEFWGLQNGIALNSVTPIPSGNSNHMSIAFV